MGHAEGGAEHGASVGRSQYCQELETSQAGLKRTERDRLLGRRTPNIVGTGRVRDTIKNDGAAKSITCMPPVRLHAGN